MPGSSPLAITKGKQTRALVALLPSGSYSRPSSVTFTLTSGGTKGGTTLSVTSVSTTLEAGQALEFIDAATGRKYIAIAAADYTTGTSITVEELPEAIPTGATALFPVEFRLRTSTGFDVSTSVSTIDTYDHTVADASPGETTVTCSAEGLYSHWDAGGKTCDYASKNTLNVWIEIELDNPDSTAYSKGAVKGGAAIVTSRSYTMPNDGEVGTSYNFQMLSNFTETDPVATA